MARLLAPRVLGVELHQWLLPILVLHERKDAVEPLGDNVDSFALARRRGAVFILLLDDDLHRVYGQRLRYPFLAYLGDDLDCPARARRRLVGRVHRAESLAELWDR